MPTMEEMSAKSRAAEEAAATPNWGVKKKKGPSAIDLAVEETLKSFRDAVQMTTPYREAGGRAMGALGENIPRGGPLEMMEREGSQEHIGGMLERLGYSPESIASIMGQYGRGLEAREGTRRFGRMRDITDIGRRFAGAGATAASGRGESLSDAYLRMAGRGSQYESEAAQYGRVGEDKAMLTGQRLLKDYLTEKGTRQQAKYTGPLSPEYTYK